jgi:hypothetical protein
MIRLFAVALLLAALPLTAGCASDSHDPEIDSLWRRGYGFNNPNYERIKNGLQPLHFDGTVHGH